MKKKFGAPKNLTTRVMSIIFGIFFGTSLSLGMQLAMINNPNGSYKSAHLSCALFGGKY